MLDAPRVERSTTKDLAITGYVYNDSGDAARNESDVGFAIAETGANLGVYRATCRIAGGAANWAAGNAVTVTFNLTNRTLQLTGIDDDWTVLGYAVDDLIRIEDAVTSGHNNVGRILSITTTTNTNDTITLRTEDTFITVNDVDDDVTVYSIGSGAIFEVERDTTGNGTVDTHIGWMASDIEAYSKDFLVWYALNRGNADWVVGDYWEWTFERGPFTLYEDKIVSVYGCTFDNTADTLTLSAEDAAKGITWASLGFVDEQYLDLVVNSGTTALDRYHITGITDDVLTFGGTPTFTDETVDIQAIPRPRVFSDPVLDVVPANPTITRDDGGDFVADGHVAGGFFEMHDSVSNNGYWLIDSVTTTVLTIDDSFGPVMVTETLPAEVAITPRNTNLQAWTEHRYRLASPNGQTNPNQDAISSSGVANGRLVRPDSDGNYVSEWIGIGPGVDPTNNPQTVYIGMQTQYSGATRQNVEHRCFDVVNDNTFDLMLAGEPTVRAYTYLAVQTPMETFMRFDGEMITGFNDVNTAVTEWWYQGFPNVIGTQGQHPRPLYLGGTGLEQNDDRSIAASTKLSAFWDPGSKSDDAAIDLNPAESCAWFRWLDGQWFAHFNKQRNNANTGDTLNDRTPASTLMKIYSWPWMTGLITNVEPSFFGGSSGWLGVVGRRPTTIDAVDRAFPLLPITLYMNDPDDNIICDLRSVFYIPGIGLATKNRHVRGHRVWYLGGNHSVESVSQFAALELD